jgi:hypothetical protein
MQYFIQHCFICRPSDSTVSEDAEIKTSLRLCEEEHTKNLYRLILFLFFLYTVQNMFILH